MFSLAHFRAAALALLAAVTSLQGASAGQCPAPGVVSGTAVTLAGSCGAAPPPGTVCMAPSEPAAGVELLVGPVDGNGDAVPVRTNAAGAFRLELPAGSYVVRLARTPSPWVFEPLRFTVGAGDEISIVVELRLLRG